MNIIMGGHVATHYEKIHGLIGARSIDQARAMADRCLAMDPPGVDPLIDHVAKMIYTAQESNDPKRAFDRMYRQSMVSFWATVQIAKALTGGYRYSTCCEQGYDKFVRASALSNDPQGLNMQAQLCWHLAMHERCGRKVYQVSPGLALNLSLTELRGLTTDLLHLPFEAVYIEVPEEADLFIHNVETDWHRCVGIYCVEDPADQDGDRAWRIMAVGESKGYGQQANHEGMLLANDALVHFRIKLPPGQKLDDVITSAIAQVKRDVATVSPNFHGMVDEWPQVFRWLMNVIIYATWPDVEPVAVWANDEARKLWQKVQRGPSNARHVRKARKKLSTLDPQKRTVLGHTIVLDRKLPRRSGPGTGRGDELAVRQRVAGHLKKVWYGEGKREWRIQRIDPYWRGPEQGEVTNSTRRLK
jgi:hypothetical protein